MALPILQAHPVAGRDDLLRLYHRIQLQWSRHLGEETPADFGTVIRNPQLSRVHDANCVLDAVIPSGQTAESIIAQIEGTKWVLAQPPNEQLATALEAAGYRKGGFEVLHRANPRCPAEVDRALTVIPARASYRHVEELARQWAAELGEEQLADAFLLHLDDPRVDALLALKEGRAAAMVTAMSVGDMGSIENLYVSSSVRGCGIEVAIFDRALEICARSLFRHAFVGGSCGDFAGVALARGFEPIGDYVEYVRGD